MATVTAFEIAERLATGSCTPDDPEAPLWCSSLFLVDARPMSYLLVFVLLFG
jgi:hypothetical protein